MNRPPGQEPPDSEYASPSDQTQSFGSTGAPAKKPNLDFLSPSTRFDSLGRLGHYEVLGILGEGGFGIVLRAFDETLQRVVAVKILAPQLAATSPARQRFLREARASAKVRHENIVQVYAIEETPLPYIVMEYVPGQTLQERMNAVGPLSAEESVRIGVQIARGLGAAHEKGIIHRDVKPGNVLLEQGVDGHVKLTDFGLARAADDASLTQSGMVAGTPHYMAPEQARGEKLDHRADLFSLGSVLYTMVSGRPPFRAENSMAVLKRVCEDTPRAIKEIIPEVPAWLCSVISKLHAKDPERRFQSAREVVEALTHREAPKEFTPATARASVRKGALLAGGGLITLLLVVGIYWAATRNGDPLLPTPTAAQPELTNIPPRRMGNLALKLEGKDHRISAATLERDEDTPVTLECWFNMPEPTPTFRTLLAFGGKEAVWIANSPDTIAPLSLRLPIASFNLGGKIPFGKWAHAALVYDQKETRFYLDGHLQSASPRLEPQSKHPRWSVGGLIIGSTRYVDAGKASFGGRFLGQIDEIRVSKIARYEEEFTPQRRFEPDASTLALYHCDEGKGEVLTDASGNQHHAAIAGNGVSWVDVAP
jgi:serine/threonine protein kinase